jgi:2-polyprenyl-3-methyl-5-hydroxy-6-metoxy-1,4-benzoquinol methylase
MICNICKNKSIPKFNYKDIILYQCSNDSCNFICIDYNDDNQKLLLTLLSKNENLNFLTRTSKKIINRSSLLKNYLVGKNIIDIGSGCARYQQALRKLNIKYNNISNIDFDKNTINYSKNYLHKIILNYNIENDKLLELGIGAFNFIISSHVIEHINNPLETLKMWCKLLDKDGYIFIECPDIDYSKPIDSWFSSYHFSYFNSNNLEMLLQVCGFDIIHKIRDPMGTKASPTIAILGRLVGNNNELQLDSLISIFGGIMDKKISEIKELLTNQNITINTIENINKNNLKDSLQQDMFIPTIDIDKLAKTQIIDIKTKEGKKDVKYLANKLDNIKNKE